MLRKQITTHKARELALHYLSANGKPGTPEEYLILLKEAEQRFLELLQREITYK